MLATKINKNQRSSFVFALMKCSEAAFGEQNKKFFILGVRYPLCRQRFLMVN